MIGWPYCEGSATKGRPEHELMRGTPYVDDHVGRTAKGGWSKHDATTDRITERIAP